MCFGAKSMGPPNGCFAGLKYSGLDTCRLGKKKRALELNQWGPLLGEP